MRTAGMIGGLGPESTIDYYRFIIGRYRARKPDGGYPHVILNSLDVDKGIALLDAERLGDFADYLVAGVESLVRAGADFGFIAANTPHHRIHRSTLWAAPLTFAVGAFAVPIGMTSAWHSFAAFLARTL